MKDSTRRSFITGAVVLCGLAGAIAVGRGCYNKQQAAKTAEQTSFTEQNRVVDNAKRSIGTDVAKFYGAMGGEMNVAVTPNADGTYTVSVPGIVVPKEKLEKYAAENVTWIEE